MRKSLCFQSRFCVILLLPLLFSLALPPLFAEQEEEKNGPTLLFKRGKILIVGENGPQALGEGSLASKDKIRIGDVDLISVQGPTAEQVATEALVIAYGEKQVVSLVAGSTLQREMSEGLANYQIEGALHLFFNAEKEDLSADFVINRIPFQSQRVHLFYNGYSEPPTLDVLEGNLTFNLPEGLQQVAAGERILWSMDSFEVLRDQPLKEGLITIATLPGFEALGIYQVVGKAEFEEGEVEIQRFGFTSRINESPTVLFKGDIIKTSSGQSVRLKLKSKDVINLSENASFEIQEFSPKKEGGSLLFKFSGKIRSKIKKRKGRRRTIRFRTAAAIIGVRGTEFEATGGESVAEVLTIEGIVGVGDSEGNGEVEVTAGMMTTVEAGKPPQEPTEIPEDRLKELQKAELGASSGTNSGPELLNQTLEIPADKPLVLNWSEAIQSIEITVGEVNIPGTLSEDKKTVEIDSQLILDQAGDEKRVTLSMKVIGEGEVESIIQKEFTLSAPSQEVALLPPTLLDKILELKEGNNLILTWNEPLQSIKVNIQDQSSDVKILEDSTKIEISGETLFKLGLDRSTIKLSMEVEGKTSNKGSIEREVRLLYEAPKLVETEFSWKQGEALMMEWDQPLTSISIRFAEHDLEVELSEKAHKIELKGEDLFQWAEHQPEVKVVIKVKGKKENEGEFEIPIHLQFKPDQPPEIKLTEALSPEPMQQIVSFKLQADRAITFWQVQLDGVEVPLVSPEDVKENEPSKVEASEPKSSNNLELTGELFGELSEGIHKILIQGTDEFGLQGEIALEIEIDRTAPLLSEKVQLGDSTEAIDLKDMIIQPGILPQFQWNEVLRSASIKILDKTLPLVLSEDRKGGSFEDEALYKLLPKSEKTSIEIISIDLAGNQNITVGNISIKEEVETKVTEIPMPVPPQISSSTVNLIPQVPLANSSRMPLWKTYKDSILKQSKSPLDQQMLLDRPKFRSSKIKAIEVFDEQRSQEKLRFKKNPPSKLSEKMGRPPLY